MYPRADCSRCFPFIFVCLLPCPFSPLTHCILLRESIGSLQLQCMASRPPLTAFTLHTLCQKGCAGSLPDWPPPPLYLYLSCHLLHCHFLHSPRFLPSLIHPLLCAQDGRISWVSQNTAQQCLFFIVDVGLVVN